MKRPLILGLTRRDETILRLGPVGSGFRMTWAADGTQFVSILDGFTRPERKPFRSRIFRICGDPPHLSFEDVAGYPHMPVPLKELDTASFWGAGCLAVDGCLYQFLTTSNHPYLKADDSYWPGFYWTGSKLIYSTDSGRTWRNQDGSFPVAHEKWDARSQQNMIFFNEDPAGAFAWLNFLQMGMNYELNRDGYAYVYGSNGYAEGTMNELVLFRVPKSQILNRYAYEFFAGLRTEGGPIWTSDASARKPVHTFPRGWVNRYDPFETPGETPWAWVPSVTYNAPLGAYLMVSWGTGCAANGGWFGKPSYLGFWTAPTPWGPFTQIHEESAWTPGNDRAARAFQPQIAPKWIAADGKSFWLVWSDYQYQGSGGETENPDQHFMQEVRNRHVNDDAAFSRFFVEWVEKHMVRTVFSLQRVDLIVG